MTPETFRKGLTLLSKAWPDTKITPDLLEVYRMALGDLHETAFQAAIAGCLKGCKFFPKPAEIREHAQAALNASGALPPMPEDAWSEVLHKARGYGWIGTPTFSHELVGQAVYAMGGIARLAASERSEQGFLRKEFIDFYTHKREQEIQWNPDLMRLPLTPRDPLVAAGRRLAVAHGRMDLLQEAKE